MIFSNLDYIAIGLFGGFILYLLILPLFRKEMSTLFFNAGGNLHWIIICASIECMNLPFDYVVSSSANGFSTGLAFGSYEWGAVIVLFFVALYFVPKYKQAGIFTLPEYLEYRYHKYVRIAMGLIFIILQLGMFLALLYTIGGFFEKFLDIKPAYAILGFSLIGGGIIFSGGMYTKVRLSLVVFFLFFICATTLLVLCIIEVGGIDQLISKADGRMNIILPADHPNASWVTLFIGGLWVLHIQYWSFYHPIMQTPLASNSLSQTQKGIFSVATLKLITPFLLIIPGIVGYELYQKEITNPDLALEVVMEHIIPDHLKTVLLLGFLSSMITPYCSFLNSCAMILSLDVVHPMLSKTGKSLLITRICVVVLVLMVAVLALLFKPGGLVFAFTQDLFAVINPVIFPVFLFAIFSKRTPLIAPVLVMILGIPVYFLIKNYLNLSVLNDSGLTAIIMCTIMLLCRILAPLKEPKNVPEKFEVKFERNLAVIIWGIFLITAVLGLYMVLI